MAFLAEDGTGIPAANSYVAVAFVDAYALERGFTSWTGADSVKEEALIRATDHIERIHGGAFRGFKRTETQGLGWPRQDAIDDNDFFLREIPKQLQQATSEYAIRALLYGVLTPDPPPLYPRQGLTTGEVLSSTGDAAGFITFSRDKVGPLETERRYDTKRAGELDSYPAADNMLLPILEPRTNTIRRG